MQILCIALAGPRFSEKSFQREGSFEEYLKKKKKTPQKLGGIGNHRTFFFFKGLIAIKNNKKEEISSILLASSMATAVLEALVPFERPCLVNKACENRKTSGIPSNSSQKL